MNFFIFIIINLAFGLMAITIQARHVKFCVQRNHVHTDTFMWMCYF